MRVLGALSGIFLLAGCGSIPFPDKPQRPMIYDFGPGVPTASSSPSHAPVALAPVAAPAPLEGPAVTYRLLYSGAGQQPQPYALARWSMSPAQLVSQRLRETLAAQRPVVNVGESLAALELRVDLEEFSQVFDSPSASFGLVRMRATAVAPLARGERLLGQRTFTARQPAPSNDAPGGVRALTEATDDLARQIVTWLVGLPAPAAALPVAPAAKP
ncbi:ABC-type transport auxiliary lipoprotein family protein [Ottowia thiooxydans]|uniref:ABC-type transport auxiliary lipoprotein family protein n=1 Tax=Ottowia thiooxydans TaxID=219182 RepID=UPI000685F8A2|nr:ABC-type transport auxiliary lipoprotein family protein [Ottowia thiooxydans]